MLVPIYTTRDLQGREAMRPETGSGNNARSGRGLGVLWGLVVRVERGRCSGDMGNGFSAPELYTDKWWKKGKLDVAISQFFLKVE